MEESNSEPTMDDLAAAEVEGVDVENEAVIPNPELEPDVPDWSNEPASDDLLAEQLQEKGLNMGEVQEEQQGSPEEAPEAPDTAPDSPGTPAPDTSPPEEQEGENGDEEDGA